ncbi:MAG: bifunctional molybdenum cofactor biosynthesis protein MoaC/MoaB [Planctomycetota bacterium]
MSDLQSSSDPGTTPTSGLTHVGPAGPRMVDVGGKAHTERVARAEATVRVGPELAEAIRSGTGRKGDVLSVAQLAGIQAVKHTADAIPLCHPLPIEGVDVVATLVDDAVVVTAEVRTVWKTGVEMEALHAASVAALTVIDMGKSVQRGLSIEQVRLLEKTGGTRGDYQPDDAPAADDCGCKPPSKWPPINAAVVTVSDRAHRGVYEDRGGPKVVAWLASRLDSVEIETALVPDEADALRGAIATWLDAWSTGEAAQRPGLIVTTGGTGLSGRDITPEVVSSMCERLHPGLPELARERTGRSNPLAYLSRGVAGVVGWTLIVTLPGSPRGAVEWLDAMEPALTHGITTMTAPAKPTEEPAR